RRGREEAARGFCGAAFPPLRFQLHAHRGATVLLPQVAKASLLLSTIRGRGFVGANGERAAPSHIVQLVATARNAARNTRIKSLFPCVTDQPCGCTSFWPLC